MNKPKIKKINPGKREKIIEILNKKDGLLKDIAFRYFLLTGVDFEELYNEARKILIEGYFLYYKENTDLDAFCYYRTSQGLRRFLEKNKKNSFLSIEELKDEEQKETIDVVINPEAESNVNVKELIGEVSAEAQEVINILLYETDKILTPAVTGIRKAKRKVFEWLCGRHGNKKAEMIMTEIKEKVSVYL